MLWLPEEAFAHFAGSPGFDNSPTGSRYETWTLAQFPPLQITPTGKSLCFWYVIERNLTATIRGKSSNFWLSFCCDILLFFIMAEHNRASVFLTFTLCVDWWNQFQGLKELLSPFLSKSHWDKVLFSVVNCGFTQRNTTALNRVLDAEAACRCCCLGLYHLFQ